MWDFKPTKKGYLSESKIVELEKKGHYLLLNFVTFLLPNLTL